MSEEVARAAGDLAYWRQRAEQAEADAAWWHATVANYVTSATITDREMLRDTMAEALIGPHPGAALLKELEAARILKTALGKIDHQPVGACESDFGGMPEPCDSCVEMREIAARALEEYDRAVKASRS